MNDTRKSKRPSSAYDGSLSPPPVKRKFESTTTSEAMKNVLDDEISV